MKKIIISIIILLGITLGIAGCSSNTNLKLSTDATTATTAVPDKTTAEKEDKDNIETTPEKAEAETNPVETTTEQQEDAMKQAYLEAMMSYYKENQENSKFFLCDINGDRILELCLTTEWGSLIIYHYDGEIYKSKPDNGFITVQTYALTSKGLFCAGGCGTGVSGYEIYNLDSNSLDVVEKGECVAFGEDIECTINDQDVTVEEYDQIEDSYATSGQVCTPIAYKSSNALSLLEKSLGITSTNDASTKKVTAEEAYQQILDDASYEQYAEAEADWTSGTFSYVIKDINDDAVPELIIQGIDSNSEIYMSYIILYTFNSETYEAVFVDIFHSYSDLYYSEQYNALVYSDILHASDYTCYGYYKLEDTSLKFKFAVGAGHDTYSNTYSFYSQELDPEPDGNMDLIADDTLDKYINEREMIEFTSI